MALGPSLRAVLRFTLGGQEEVRRGEPGHALVSHVSPLPQQPAASSRCPPASGDGPASPSCPWPQSGAPGPGWALRRLQFLSELLLPTQHEGGTGRLGCPGLHSLPCPSADPSSPDELTCSARLTVRPSLAPLFTRLLEDVEVLEGRAARFDCKISGSPPPSITWTHFGMALHPTDVGGREPPGVRGQGPWLRLPPAPCPSQAAPWRRDRKSVV